MAMRNLDWEKDYMLVQKSLSGNTDAWKTLYEKAYPIVSGYVRRISIKQYLPYDQMEDIVSEAFERSYRKRASYTSRCKFSTWVCGFSRYILLHKYYHFFIEQTKYSLYFASLPSMEEHLPENYIIKQEQYFCIRVAFKSLCPLHQLLISCYILQEIQPKEVIRITNLKASARKAILQIALHTLRNRYLSLYK